MTDRKKLRETAAAVLAAVVAFVVTERWDLFEIVGLALLVTGVFLWSIPAGFVATGLMILLIVYPVIPKRWRR